MGRIVIIENCGQCPECGFNENHELKDYSEHFCLVTGNEIELYTMPDNCPLPIEVGRDYESEIARYKRQLMQYRTLYSNNHGKF